MSDEFKIQKTQLLVIGGGVNGAAIARDAALRGIDVLLVDKGDFGSGSSSGCFRIAHGGLRYLQHFDFLRLFESVREQRILRRVAPNFLKPLKFLIPCYGIGKKSKWYLGLGLWLYEVLTFWRNFGVSKDLSLAMPKVLSRARVLEIAGGIESSDLRGGVVFSDCQIVNCDRLTYSIARSAEEAGARIRNYTKALKFQRSGSRIESVVLEDSSTSRQFEVSVDFVVNSSGPWLNLETEYSLEPKVDKKHSKGVQLTFPQLVDEYALVLESQYQDSAAKISRGGRSFFLVPWRGVSIAGTTDSIFSGSADDFCISEDESLGFAAELEQLLGVKKLHTKVLGGFGGLRPLDEDCAKRGQEGDATVLREHRIVDHAQNQSAKLNYSCENLLSVEGVKYTTFRSLAEKVVDLVVRKTSISCLPCESSRHSIYGGERLENSAAQKELRELLGETELKRILREFGSCSDRLIPYLKKDSGFVDGNSGITRAEVRYVASNEHCQHLADVVCRRLPLLSEGELSANFLNKLNLLVAEEKGWSQTQIDSEAASLAQELEKLNSLPS